jgi:hypothetical protein
MSQLSLAVRACSLIAVAVSSASLGTACRSGGCEPGEGVALVFEPSRGTPRDAEAARSKVEAISKAQLIVGERVVVVFVAGREHEAFLDAKDRVLEQTQPLGLELMVEDLATTDAACTVKLKHQEQPIRKH